MMRTSAILALAALLATPAFAQDHSGHGSHGDPAPADPHAGHRMPAASGVGEAPAPEPPSDHAADALHDPVAMERARRAMRRESGGMGFSMVTLDLAEIQVRDGRDAYRFEGAVWTGGDIDRAKLKAKVEGDLGSAPEHVELQALWSRAIDPWWNLNAGVRYDVSPDPSRAYAVLGVEGVAPWWFHVEGAAFVSTKGDVHLRVEGSYDQRITQRLILQPRIEANAALQQVPELGIGGGLSDIELGLRLRYEVVPEFAPYVGVQYARKLGDTARFARAAGEGVGGPGFVAGVRLWF